MSLRRFVSSAALKSSPKPRAPSNPKRNAAPTPNNSNSPEELARICEELFQNATPQSTKEKLEHYDAIRAAFSKTIATQALVHLSIATLVGCAEYLPGVHDPESFRNDKNEGARVIETHRILQTVLDELDRRAGRAIGSSTQPGNEAWMEDLVRNCHYAHLVVHALALQGDCTEARRLARRLVQEERDPGSPSRAPSAKKARNADLRPRRWVGMPPTSVRLLKALTQTVAAHRRAKDYHGAIRSVLGTFTALRPHLLELNRDGEITHLHRQAGDELRREVNFTVVSQLDRGVGPWFAEHRPRYSEVYFRKLGELLIRAYAEQERPVDALAVFDVLSNENISTSATILALLLRTTTDFRMWPSALRIYELYQVKAKSRPGEASDQFLLESMRYFSHKGDAASVEDINTELERLGITSAATESWRLHVLASSGNIMEVERLWNLWFPSASLSTDPSSDSPVPSSSRDLPRLPNFMHFVPLVTAYATIGDADGITQCLDLMSRCGYRPEVRIFNEIVRCYAKRGDQDAVFRTIGQMRDEGVVPNEATFLVLIKMHGQRRDIFGAEKMFQAARSAGYEPTQRLVLELMRAHVNASSWRGVIRIFDYLSSSTNGTAWIDVQVYNLLLRAYVLVGTPMSTVLDVVRKIEELGIVPNDETLLLVIQSTCDAGELDAGLQLFEKMELLPDLGRGASVRSAEAFALTLLMGTHLKREEREEARHIYDLMQERGVVPDSVGLGLIVHAYGNEGNAEGIRLAEEFLATLVDPSSDQGWLEASSTSSGVGSERAWLNIYLPVMVANARRSNPRVVERYFTQLSERTGKPPSVMAMTPLLDVYRRVGDVEGMSLVWKRIFETALEQTKPLDINALLRDPQSPSSGMHSLLPPSSDPESSDEDEVALRSNILCMPLSVYILGLSSAGLHERIAEVWAEAQSHGFGFDNHNWNHLAVALVRAGEPARAFQVVEEVILPSQAEARRNLKDRTSTPSSPTSFVAGSTSPTESLSLTSETVPENVEEYLESLRLGRAGTVDHRSEKINETARHAGNRVELDSLEDLGPDDRMRWETAPPVGDEDLIPPPDPLEDIDESDIAAPLHSFYQESPAWTLWRPHRMTLQALHSALQTLAAGRMIRPADGGSPQNFGHHGGIDDPSDAALAQETYENIVNSYPFTVELLRAFVQRLASEKKKGIRIEDSY